jgi:hypothetical protein
VSTRRIGCLPGGLPEEALSGPEHNRVDHQPQLVDQVGSWTTPSSETFSLITIFPI